MFLSCVLCNQKCLLNSDHCRLKRRTYFHSAEPIVNRCPQSGAAKEHFGGERMTHTRLPTRDGASIRNFRVVGGSRWVCRRNGETWGLDHVVPCAHCRGNSAQLANFARSMSPEWMKGSCSIVRAFCPKIAATISADVEQK